MEVKNKTTRHMLKVDIRAGISPNKLAQLLKTYQQFLLEGKEKTIAIEGNKIVVFDHQIQIDLAHIPSEIGDFKLSDFEKKILLKGDLLHLGDASIQLEEGNKQLKIERPDGQKVLKMRL